MTIPLLILDYRSASFGSKTWLSNIYDTLNTYLIGYVLYWVLPISPLADRRNVIKTTCPTYETNEY